MTHLIDLIDGLHRLGTWSAEALWLPLAAWTLVVLAALALLRAHPPHPLVGCRVRQALLAALPAGLALAAVTDWTLPLLPAASAPGVTALPLVAPAASVAAPATPTLPAFTWTHTLGLLTVLAALLAAWRLVCLGVSAVRLVRLRRSLDARVPAATREAAAEVARRLGVRRRYRLAHAPPGTAPMTMGCRPPVVALPPAFSGEALRMALTHELIHLHRRDDLCAWGEALLAAVFFAHPLCTLLRRQIDARREAATDAALLGGHAFSRRRYAQLLFDVAGPSRASLTLSLAAPSHSLKKRLRAMKTRSQAPPRFSLALAALSLALPLLLMACSDLSAPTEADPATAAVSQTTTAPDSLLRQSIASISVTKGAPEGNVMDIYVKPGTPEDVREQLRQQLGKNVDDLDRITISDAPGPEHADAFRDTQDALDGHVQGKNTIQIPAPEVDERLTGFIQSIGVRKPEQGAPKLHITLKPGTPRDVREDLREQIEASQSNLDVTFETLDAASSASRQAPRDTVEVANLIDKPAIVGGQRALADAIRYPQAARADRLEGIVYVQFIVDEEGRATEAEVLRGVAPALDRAALQAIRSLTFRPAKKDGEPVPMRMVQPVRFALGNEARSSSTGSPPPTDSSYENSLTIKSTLAVRRFGEHIEVMSVEVPSANVKATPATIRVKLRNGAPKGMKPQIADALREAAGQELRVVFE